MRIPRSTNGSYSSIAEKQRARSGRIMHNLLLPVFAFLLFFPTAAFSRQLSLKEAKAKFEKADASLNQVWESLKKTLPAEQFDELKIKQRDWLHYRDHLALSPAFSGAPSDEAQARKSPEYFDSAAEITNERVLWLKAFPKELPYEDGAITGSWSDSFGGQMEIVQKGNKLYFTITVIRGATAHSGNISGIAFWNPPLGWFSDKGKAEGKSEESNLAFHRKGNEIEVIGANTLYYHGARAFFDGTYLKTGSFSAAEQKRVVEESR